MFSLIHFATGRRALIIRWKCSLTTHTHTHTRKHTGNRIGYLNSILGTQKSILNTGIKCK